MNDSRSAHGGGGATDRDELILAHMSLVKALARRYANRGESLEDLVQVGTIGLIKAANAYDPNRGAFPSFATPTILGEIRRHFRDRVWMLNVPRSLQESNAAVNKAIDALTTEIGRSPTVREVAGHTGLGMDDVLEAMAVSSAYAPGPLLVQNADGEESVVDAAVEEGGFELVEDRAGLAEALAELPARERMIIDLRFNRGMTQSQIASRIGISQMHVSRLLAGSIKQLRERLS